LASRPLARLRKKVLFGLTVAAVAIAGLLLQRHLSNLADPIDAERLRRLTMARLGQPLPGTPDTARLEARLAEAGFKIGAPVFIRIFKQEFELELWMRRGDHYELFATYPICRWSGRLGPKLREGDRQAPEGFYTVDAAALNPNSRWRRSFNLGFPNAYDRSYGRSGTFLMVHGGCSSIGCYAMTDAVIDELWRLVTAALTAGQPRFAVHVYPFRMTSENLAQHGESPWAEFWRDLKAGYDAFETTRIPPGISVCRGRYLIGAAQRRDPPVVAGCPRQVNRVHQRRLG
jgi:murein L,D-transpeptidase YafK